MTTLRLPLAVYSAIYVLLFLQFPLTGSLPGNCDTLASISLVNVWNEKVSLFLRGLDVATVMYPSLNFQAYGENCYGLGFIFTFFKILGANDHWAYYGLLVVVFTLNSLGAFELMKLFVSSRFSAFAGGLVVSLANFTLGNIDDVNVVFVFFPLLAFALLERSIREGNRRLVFVAFFLSGLQIWFGAYVFLFHALALALYVVMRRKALGLSIGAWARSCAVYLVPASPILVTYFFNGTLSDLVSPYDNPLGRKLSSLHWYHFKNVLPGNLLYSSATNDWRPNDDVSDWYNVRKTCFPGFLLPSLALLGAAFSWRKTGVSLVIGAVFLGLAFGTNLYGLEEIAALPFGSYFRVTSRFYLVTLIVLAIHFAIGLDVLVMKAKTRWSRGALAIPALAAAVFVLENVPFPMPAWNYATLLEPPAEYVRFFEGSERRRIVADLPSDYRARLPQTAPVWSFSRELLYMNWQPYHHQVIVGGVNGYLPKVRIELDEWLQKIPAPEAIAALKKVGVSHFVFHKKLVLIESENVLDAMKASPELKLELEAPEVAIFGVVELAH